MKIYNITYLSCSSIPSAFANSVHVMKMCKSFVDNGLKVNLICKKSNEWVSKSDSLHHYGCYQDFKISAFSTPLKGKLYSIAYILYALKQVILAPDLIYARYFYPLLPLLLFPKPFVLEFHNDINAFNRFIVLQLMRRKSCKLMVFISESLKNLFIEKYNADPNKCLVLSDACDISHTSDNYNTKNIGYVGHLYKGRGCELIIEIANKLPEYTFHIIGGKDPELSYYKSISPFNIIYYGSVKHSLLSDYYSKFGIALAPYQEKIYSADERCETSSFCSPMKLFEYMSHKKPIVCSDLPVFHEVADNDIDIVFVDSKNVDEWVKAIMNIEENLSYRDRLVSNSYNRFINNYTWSSRVDKILKRF